MPLQRRSGSNTLVPKALRHTRSLSAPPGSKWIKSRNGYTLRVGEWNFEGPPKFYDANGQAEVIHG